MIFVSLFFLFSCDKNETVENLFNSEEKEETSLESTLNYKALFSQHHTMGLDEAAKMAKDAARVLIDDGELRTASVNREIADVHVFGKGKSALRASSIEDAVLPDTLAYVFNFSDSAGYAIICADDRVGCPVLACVEKGSFDIEGELNNPGLDIFLDNAQIFMEQSILRFERDKDSLLLLAEKMEDRESYSESLRKTYTGGYYILLDDEYVGPLLSTAWGQDEPYNSECPPCSGNTNMKVGCWAVAVGQVLAYHKNPKSLDGCTFDYVGMTGEKHIYDFVQDRYYLRSHIAKLLHSVGVVLEMDYGCSHSGTNAEELIPWLRKKGYDVMVYRYVWNIVKRQLDFKHPVLMHGKRTRRNPFYSENGHAWVLDGYKVTKTLYETYKVDTDKDTYEITSSTTKYIDYFLHINWGWDGASNGYFVQGCFNSSDSEYFDDPKDGVVNYNYQYDQEILILAD